MKIQFGLGDIPTEFGIIYAPIKSAMQQYFINKTYGSRNLIIFYVVICLDEKRFDLPTPLLLYNPELSVVECSIDLSYSLASSYTTQSQFVRYVMNSFLDISSDFSDLNIDGFDLDIYRRDLEEFFNRYMEDFADNTAVIYRDPSWG